MFTRLLSLPLDQQLSIFLFGPRGTGKTSWLRTHLPQSLYLDLLDYSLYNSLRLNPNRLENLIPPNHTDWIIIDEVQRIPELLNEVHRLIELKKLRFILTGSSARALRKKGTNLLAGRALRYTMHPLTIQELGDTFNIKHALQFGLLPTAWTQENPKKYLETYVHTYVNEEVAQEGLARNIDTFSKFLESASFSQGQLLNFSEIGREVGIHRQVVATYFSILEDLLLAIRLNPFTKRAKRKIVAHQKFFFFDVGVYKALRPTGLLDTPAEVGNVDLATLFLQSALAVNDYYDLGYKFYFWRTSSGAEVDFVLYGERGLHAFEIKRGDHIKTKSLKGLKKFGNDYPEAKLHLLYGGNHREYHGNITVHPIVDALKELPTILK